jgi:hypothetical protein
MISRLFWATTINTSVDEPVIGMIPELIHLRLLGRLITIELHRKMHGIAYGYVNLIRHRYLQVVDLIEPSCFYYVQ